MSDSTYKLYRNGQIFTSKHGDEELHQAMLVKNAKIVAVGTEEQVKAKVQGVSRMFTLLMNQNASD